MLVGPIRRSFAFVGAVALGLSLALTACGGDDDTTSAPTTTTSVPELTTTVTTTTTESTTTTQAPATTDSPTTTAAPTPTTLVNVYWGWTVLNPRTGSPEQIGAGARQVAADTPVRNALEAMFDGPSPLEQSIGMTSSIPAGTSVLGIAVDGAVATVDLSAEFAASSGSLDEMMRLAQVVFAVTQFEDFEQVKFHIDGVARDPILSHGFQVGDGLTRNDFEIVRPAILIEDPYPGADVGDPLVIRGESNTFEGTVRYAITSGGGDGLVVIEGFSTSTGGNGIWGDFEVVVDLAGAGPGYEPGPGSVIMWEDSARDGSRLGVVEIPVVLPAL
jgi:germination protein M